MTPAGGSTTPAPPAISLRPARPEDAGAIARLVNRFAGLGLMLPRPEAEVRSTIRDFLVALEEDDVVGCGALAFYGFDLAEVRSIAVRADREREGLGSAIVRALLAEAEAQGIPRVLCFTYVPEFFARFGFRVVPADTLPRKAWTDCVKCPKRFACDEVAMLRDSPEEPA